MRIGVLFGLHEEVIDPLQSGPPPAAPLAVEKGGQGGHGRVHRRRGLAKYIALSAVRIPGIGLRRKVQIILRIIVGNRNFPEFLSPQLLSSLDDDGLRQIWLWRQLWFRRGWPVEARLRGRRRPGRQPRFRVHGRKLSHPRWSLGDPRAQLALGLLSSFQL